MTIELSQEQHEVLKQTARVETPAAFQALLVAAKPRMDSLVREVQEPSQAIPTTLIELRDLALTVHHYALALDEKKYLQAQRTAYFNVIRLLDTAQAWFGEGLRTGAFRTRSVEETVTASRPWRARLKAFADHAFFADGGLAEQLGDVNSSGTLQEEVDDLGTLNELVEQHREALEAVGLDEAFAQQGKTLHDEASGRDLSGILGLRNRTEATALRNRILTYAVLLGREARAAGVNACFEDPEARRRFEAASFRDALRRLRPRRSRSGTETAAEGGETSPDASPAPAKGGAPG